MAPWSVCNAASSAVPPSLFYHHIWKRWTQRWFIPFSLSLHQSLSMATGHVNRRSWSEWKLVPSWEWESSCRCTNNSWPQQAPACYKKPAHLQHPMFLQRARHSRPVSFCCTKTCLYPSLRLCWQVWLGIAVLLRPCEVGVEVVMGKIGGRRKWVMVSVKQLTLYTLAMRSGRRAVGCKSSTWCWTIKDNYNYDTLYAYVQQHHCTPWWHRC